MTPAIITATCPNCRSPLTITQKTDRPELDALQARVAALETHIHAANEMVKSVIAALHTSVTVYPKSMGAKILKELSCATDDPAERDRLARKLDAHLMREEPHA